MYRLELQNKQCWQLIWLKNKKLGVAQTAFLNYLKEEKDAILHDKFQWFEQF